MRGFVDFVCFVLVCNGYDNLEDGVGKFFIDVMMELGLLLVLRV